MKRFLKRSAFTIVEMVIVIAVIGILATVMVPTISGMIERANKSADTQFAASLTIQLAMESVDGGINSEADLRRIVDQYYGEWEGDTLVTRYYDTKLVPKAAKSGNHFWYNIMDGSVTAGTYAEISVLPGPASATDGAPSEPPAPDFEKANPRTIKTTNGNYFFLMDCGGAEIVGDVFNLLDGCPDHVEMGTVFEALNAPDYTETDNALASAVLEKLLKTGILTNSGLIAGSINLEYIYVPGGTTRLGSSTYLYNGTEVSSSSRSSITIPENYVVDLPAGSMFGEDSLKGFPDSTQLNIPTDDASKLGDFFEPNSAYISGSTADNNVKSFVIVLGSSVRYGQDEAGGFYLLNADGTMGDAVSGVTSGYKQELESFTVGLDSTANKKLYIKTDGNILYIANDYTGDLILSANDFKDTEGNTMTPGRVTWQYTDASDKVQSVTGEKLTVAANNVAAGTSVMVQVQGQFQKMTAKLVKVEGVYIDKLDGNAPTDYDSQNGNRPTFTLQYDATKGKAWDFNPGYYTTDNIADDEDSPIVLDVQWNVEVSPENSKLTYSKQDKQLVMPVVPAAAAYNLTATVNFGSGSATNSIKVNVVDTSEESFEGIVTHVGTVNKVKLEQLFAKKSGVSLSGQNVYLQYSLNGTPIKMEVYNDAWQDVELDFAGITEDMSIEIKLAVAGTVNDEDAALLNGKWSTLTVNVIAGAINVDSASDWVTVDGTANKKGLVLLENLTINKAISVTSSTIYGNNYAIKSSLTGQGSNLISLSNGHIQNLIVNGPVYPELVYSGGGKYFCHGVSVTGTSTISNSYISGFRAPVRTNGNSGETVNITNTVLEGGIYGNLYVWCASNKTINVKLTGVTTIQKGYKSDSAFGDVKNVIGAGVVLDTSVKKGTTLTIDSTTRQFNWVSENDQSTYSDVGSYAPEMFDKFSSLVVKVNNVKYAHAGILKENQYSTNPTVNVPEGTYNNTSKWVLTKTIYAWSYKANPTVDPVNIKVGKTTYATYADLVAFLNGIQYK